MVQTYTVLEFLLRLLARLGDRARLQHGLWQRQAFTSCGERTQPNNSAQVTDTVKAPYEVDKSIVEVEQKKYF